MNEWPRVSVVIVNWNSREDLARCLESLRAQDERPYEVVVVDNGSGDGSPEHVRTRFPEVRLLEAGTNLGFAEGCNRGIAAANGSWIAILNNDAEADRSWLAELVAAVRCGAPRLGCVQSRVVFRQRPTHTNSTGIVLLADGRARDRDFDVPLRSADTVEQIFCATAAAALYRREMLEEVKLSSGYFDRDFFMYMEDVDLGWRCRLTGWDALYVPASIVYHAYQGSSSRRGKHFVVMQCKKNRLRTLVKNASAAFFIRGLPRTAIDVAQVARAGGARPLAELLVAAVEATRQRRAISRLLRVPRRAVERRWAGESSARPGPRRA